MAMPINYNLITIAAEAGIHKHIWYSEEVANLSDDEYRNDLINGLIYIKDNYDELKKKQPSNGYGTIDDLIDYIQVMIDGYAYVKRIKQE